MVPYIGSIEFKGFTTKWTFERFFIHKFYPLFATVSQGIGKSKEFISKINKIILDKVCKWIYSKIMKVLEDENWRPIPGYEGYEISNHGNLRNCKKEKPYIIATHKELRGYMTTKLTMDGISVQVRIHQLVARAFIGLPPDGCHVHHRDGDPSNNHHLNLTYVSKNKHLGDYHSKLSPAEKAELRELYQYQVDDLEELGKHFGISSTHAYQLIRDLRE